MNASNQPGFLMLLGAKIPIVHFMVYLFDSIAAAVVTALSVYGLLFKRQPRQRQSPGI